MHKVLLAGAGRIGRAIAAMLGASGDYDVLCADVDANRLALAAKTSGVATLELDVTDRSAVERALRGRDAVVSALSFAHNRALAEAASRAGTSYFDLTEDVATTRELRALARRARPGQVYMPQCGLAPGFVSIAAAHLAGKFERLDGVHLRVGALPQFPSNSLGYNLTWSTDGLINEYLNPCEAIVGGERTEVRPLEGLEHVRIDGVRYEAFNTSGGIGSLCETFAGRVRALDYKTLRYPGHRKLMAFLLGELRLGERREQLKEILERAVPATSQDVVVVLARVSGWRGGELVEAADTRFVYPQAIAAEEWTAIQVSTAAGLCAALDLALTGALPSTGFVPQESIDLDAFLANRFGRCYARDARPGGGPRAVGAERGRPLRSSSPAGGQGPLAPRGRRRAS